MVYGALVRRVHSTTVQLIVGMAGAGACPTWSVMTFALDHLGIAVKSLADAKSIYEKLGLTISDEETVPAEKVRLVMVPIGETRLELLEATSNDSVIAKYIEKRGEGLHHICMRVPDLAAAVQTLKSENVRLVTDEVKIGAAGHRYVFVHPASTGGVLLELAEATTNEAQAK